MVILGGLGKIHIYNVIVGLCKGEEGKCLIKKKTASM